MEKELYFMGLEKKKEFLYSGAGCQAFFERSFRGLLFSKKSLSPRSLNVELWKYIQEAQLSSDGEPLP